ncbi:MAG: tol-pal system-associated acyl-CoA thioesterase [Pseudomonadota bacterium]|jgi:acyl-CoA thioester hydrolase
MKHEQKPTAFTLPIRVYYEDTDAGGVVYYANYLKFFERCRTEWIRSAGHDQSVLLEEQGIAFMVRSVSMDYLKPARLDDLLSIGLEVAKLGRAQVIFRQHARRQSADGNWEELVTGTVQVACVNLNKMKTTAIPEFLRNQLEALS